MRGGGLGEHEFRGPGHEAGVRGCYVTKRQWENMVGEYGGFEGKQGERKNEVYEEDGGGPSTLP